MIMMKKKDIIKYEGSDSSDVVERGESSDER